MFIFEIFSFVFFQEALVTLDAYYATIIIGVVQVCGSSTGVFLVNSLGRRTLLLLSTTICCLTISFMGVAVHLEWEWPSLIALVLFTYFFTLGLGPVPWILVGELPTGK